MKILLHQKGNLAFVESCGASWTAHRGRAHAFANGLEAILFCYDRHLTNMQILATFSDAKQNFTVSIVDS